VHRLAAKVWSLATRPKERKVLQKTKLESPAESEVSMVRVPSDQQIGRFRFRVRDDWRRIGLLFWVQRKRYWTPKRVGRILLGVEEPPPPGPEEGLENAVRSLVFRLKRPGAYERFHYGLDANGDPDWDREPWRSLPGGRREPEARR
jgi:hypothetical protein